MNYSPGAGNECRALADYEFEVVDHCQPAVSWAETFGPQQCLVHEKTIEEDVEAFRIVIHP